MSCTPGPCKCSILEDADGFYQADDGQFCGEISYCPLHAAAPTLLEALKEVMVDYRQCGMQDRQVMTVVKDALQHAEGKE